MKLWRVTGEERYLKTARFFIDCRGRTPNYLLREMNDPNHKVIFPELRNYDPSYSQSHVRPVEQKTMEGHAVRAMYQCSAMADLADIQQDEALRSACQTLWNNVTKRRMYITGGIGSSGLLERFTVDYDLPNDRMYCESCASIGLMMFGQRMAAMSHDASYYETVERALCNTVLGGVSAAGDRYFYVNPLGGLARKLQGPHLYRVSQARPSAVVRGRLLPRKYRPHACLPRAVHLCGR